MYCPHCYRMIPDNSKECSNCGKSFTHEAKHISAKKMDKKPKLFLFAIFIWVFAIFLFFFTETYPSTQYVPDYSDGVEVYQGNGIRIIAKNISYDGDSAQISILVENKNSEAVGIYCNTFIVNGATVPGALWVDVAANAKANSAIYFDSHELYMAGIDNIVSAISYDAHISFPDSARETKYITFGAETDDADNYIQHFDYTGDVLYNQNGITVISKFQPGQKTRKIPLMIENNSGRDFHVWTKNVTANGYTIPEWHGNTIVCDGTVRYLEVELFKQSMEENNVEYINTASMSIDFMAPKSSYVLWETGTLKFK